MKLVDVHCHLGDESFKHDLNDVLARASAAGVAAIVSSAISMPEILSSLEISARHPGYVFTSVGSDPSKLDQEWVEPIQQIIRHDSSQVIGIGEVGLDHYWVKDPQKQYRQLQLFKEWIALAVELNLPLTVHSRNASRESLSTVESSGFDRVLMHAYDGKVGHAMEAAKEGIMFSIPASVVLSEQKQKLVRRLPLENLMLETDAPVLSPVKGERNEPQNVAYSARKIAELKRIDVDSVADITSKNAAEFFNLPNID